MQVSATERLQQGEIIYELVSLASTCHWIFILYDYQVEKWYNKKFSEQDAYRVKKT